VTTPREQLIEGIAKVIDNTDAGVLRAPERSLQRGALVLQALSDLGAVVLMPLKVKQIPEGSRVHLSPPIVSLNWPEGAYRPFVNGDSRIYINALEGQR
jgi:hypothetical protein